MMVAFYWIAAAISLFTPAQAISFNVIALAAVEERNNNDTSCLHASEWYDAFNRETPWNVYSQGFQDSVLDSLLSSRYLDTTNKYFVEFGFDADGYRKANQANTKYLREKRGWSGLLLDGGHEYAPDNLHKAFIAPENIVSLFREYKVPDTPDYVSIDIDSCDLWVFLALTEQYRPRVVTVEYNSNYILDESKTNICKDASNESYMWDHDTLYGASLMALHLAAQARGYTTIYCAPPYDVFLIREDLTCPGSELNVEAFRSCTGIPNEKHHKDVSESERMRWVTTYPA